MQTRSRRKAVSAGSVAGPPRSLGSREGRRRGEEKHCQCCWEWGSPFSWGRITSGLGGCRGLNCGLRNMLKFQPLYLRR